MPLGKKWRVELVYDMFFCKFCIDKQLCFPALFMYKCSSVIENTLRSVEIKMFCSKSGLVVLAYRNENCFNNIYIYIYIYIYICFL